MSTDLERRLRLRAFLIQARSRLSPARVGLPETARRRVPGLRREEVAELADVSAEWYRLFESGRPITISSRLVGRLSKALALDAFEEALLFRLALPELYQAELVASVEPPSTMSTLAAPVTRFADVEEARRVLSAQRERFLTSASDEEASPDPETATILRPRILASWKRSVGLAVESTRSEALWSGAAIEAVVQPPMHEHLLDVASTVVAHLANTLSDIGYATVLTDRSGTILDIHSDRDLRRRLDRIGFGPGANWSERSAGTNAIGTALRDGRPLQLMSAEHYCDGWQDLTCTAAPIRDTETGETIGVLDITGDYRLVRPQLVGAVVQYALEIEERLALPG